MRKGICSSSSLIDRRFAAGGQARCIAFVAEHLAARHHAAAPLALEDVSIEAAVGEIVAVVGANGSGKSTLARVLAGLLPVEAGEIGWRGAPLGRSPRVGLVLQDPAAQAIGATVADDIAWGPERSGYAPDATAAVVARVLRELDLVALAARHPGELSGGQQQRVAAGALIACDVDVLVLDEPGAMLDAAARARFADAVRVLARDCAVVWITQRGDELARADRVVVLDAGHSVWVGPTRDFLARPELAATWDVELPAQTRIAHAFGLDGPPPRDIDELIAILGGDGGA
jgi:energy-coupling factor transporter ATP-binding protein EcfA2